MDGMQVIDQTGEKPEERLLLEGGTLCFVKTRQDQDKDREDLPQVMDLFLIIVDSRSIAVIFDDVYDKTRQSVHCLEGVFVISDSHAFDAVVDAGFGANPEEERGDIFYFKNSLFRCVMKGTKLFSGEADLFWNQNSNFSRSCCPSSFASAGRKEGS
jgi:hypothetical protein